MALLLLTGVCLGAANGGDDVGTNTSAGPSYNSNMAINLAAYAQSAYCPDETVMNWSCPLCKSRPQLRPLTVLRNDTSDIHGWVGVDTQENQIILSFRGTEDLTNWITDLDGYSKADLSLPFCMVKGQEGAAIHQGFFEAYDSIQAQLHAAMRSAMQQHPGWPIIITGHSLGAAMTLLAALDLICINQLPGVTIYNYGSPRVGNQAFANVVAGEPRITLWRHVHWRDIVPHLPPDELLGYHHAATEVFLKEDWNHTYHLCDGSGEDPKCSYGFDYYSTSDHLSYFNMTMDHANC